MPGTPATFSFEILATLLLILAVSGWVFQSLTQQWTTHRPGTAAREWARENSFQIRHSPDELPSALAGLAPLDAKVETVLTCGKMLLIRLSTADRPVSPRLVWNLLVHESVNAKTPAGLRPATAVHSIIDLFTLGGFPSLLPPERFVVFASDARAARSIANSNARGLLPADIGLLVHGPYTTLDFSTRPFDAIEFDRMLVILDQLTRFDSDNRRR